MNLKNINKVKWTNEMECHATSIIFAVNIIQDLILISEIGGCSKILSEEHEEQEFLSFFENFLPNKHCLELE